MNSKEKNISNKWKSIEDNFLKKLEQNNWRKSKEKKRKLNKDDKDKLNNLAKKEYLLILITTQAFITK